MKKANSVIGSFLQKAEEDNGCLADWSWNQHYQIAELEAVNKYIKPYFNVLSDSATYNSKKGYLLSSPSSFLSSIGYEMFSSKNGGYPEPFKTINGGDFSGYNYMNIYFLTTDGFVYGWGWHQSQLTGRREMEFLVDINGPKRPNVAGKDVFMFKIGGEYCQSKVWPYKLGNQSCDGKGHCTYFPHKCGSGEDCRRSGFDCTCKIVEDGWQIKDDYPW